MIIKLNDLKPIMSVDDAEVYEIIGLKTNTKCLSVAYAVVHPNEETKLHFHNFTEVYIIVKGKGIITLDDNSTLVEEKNIILINKKVKHKIKNVGNEDLEFYSVCSPAFNEKDTVLI